jgi:hypothetical protein
MNVAEIAQKALSLIPSPSSWSHQDWETDSGRICLGMALIRAAGVLPWMSEDCLKKVPQPVLDRTAAIIREQFPDWRICPGHRWYHGRAAECTCPPEHMIPSFNDYWRTRHRHVQLVLEKLRSGNEA